jgi:Plasmid pRiA4b ORF-3-like protein
MLDSSQPVIYQLKIVLLGISPMIWRRILVSSNSTIEDLHYIVQLTMGWSDIHLHYFIIHGQQYGITQPGGTVFSTRACEEKLASLIFFNVLNYDLADFFQRHSTRFKQEVKAVLQALLQ